MDIIFGDQVWQQQHIPLNESGKCQEISAKYICLYGGLRLQKTYSITILECENVQIPVTKNNLELEMI